MTCTAGDVAAAMARWAPPEWAEEWDNVGLLLGASSARADRVLVALEITDAVLNQALDQAAQMLVVHHPTIFRPLSRIDTAGQPGQRLQKLLAAGIAVYAAHTNLDVAPGGTNDTLARLVGLPSPRVLKPSGRDTYLKLVVYIPAGHEDAVLTALSMAGAGQIGAYSHCSFRVPGTGTFRPLPGAQPFLGQVGELEQVSELRLETIVPAARVEAAVQAMLAAHPYEEVAYDLIPLANPGLVRGHGRIGDLAEPVALAVLVAQVRSVLQAPGVRMVGDPALLVQRVAVGAGSGADLIGSAARAGAQVLITGDVGYHQAQDAQDLGLAIIDPGHYTNEAPVVPEMVDYLRRELADFGPPDVFASDQGRDPFVFSVANDGGNG